MGHSSALAINYNQNPNRIPRWTEEQKEKILDHFNNKWSMLKIAAEMGCSRNSIASIIRRIRRDGPINGKLIKPAYSKGDGIIIGDKRRIQKTETMLSLIKLTKAPEVKRIRLRVIENSTAVTLEFLESHMCKFPQGDPKQSDFRFCGKPRVAGCPYCEYHMELTTRPSIRRYV